MKLKILAIVLIVLMITNLVAFIAKAISPLYFWILTAIIAFIAFKVIPKMRNR